MIELKIQNTDSINELAIFWDTHDITDFEDQLEEAKEPIFEREIVVSIQLHGKDEDIIKKLAKSKCNY